MKKKKLIRNPTFLNETLFRQKNNVSKNLILDHLHQIEIPTLSVEHAQACEGVIVENEILMVLRKMYK